MAGRQVPAEIDVRSLERTTGSFIETRNYNNNTNRLYYATLRHSYIYKIMAATKCMNAQLESEAPGIIVHRVP